jgi:signal transduction histidine kinase
MHSAAQTESDLFRRARNKLTAWYVIALAAVLLILGSLLYLVVREQVLSGIDNGIRTTAERTIRQYHSDGTVYLPEWTTSTTTVYFVKHSDQMDITKMPRADYDAFSAAIASKSGRDLRSSTIGDDSRRVYTVRIGPRYIQSDALIQVIRSVEPERQALSRLVFGLLVGGLGGLLLAGMGGWFLAGKSLEPVRLAFNRQHAFVSDASHELRTPLAVIRANAEYLQLEQPENAEVADIVSESERLSALVETLLALARGDVAGAGLERALVDLGEVVEAAVTSMQPLAEERQVELTVVTGDGMTVLGDREQLRQLVIILVDNGLRYTPADGRVHVQAGADRDSAVLTVHDNGIGIPPEAVGRVFERFYRADSARTRDSGGAGLGLAIARELVGGHGGRIEVDSTEGAGTTFTVRLPLARQPAARPTV